MNYQIEPKYILKLLMATAGLAGATKCFLNLLTTVNCNKV